MEGRILVESKLGEGSTFRFILPTLEADPSDLDEEIALGTIDFAKRLDGHILLVEDNKTNQMLMFALLEDLALEVDLAQNGIEAVEKFKEKKYDLILMDENMPQMGGIEATAIILEIERERRLEHTPIIALTANALATDRARFLEAGMDEFVAKPLDHEAFIRMLHSYLL
jgi:CheY-like chemotaxis protein